MAPESNTLARTESRKVLARGAAAGLCIVPLEALAPTAPRGR